MGCIIRKDVLSVQKKHKSKERQNVWWNFLKIYNHIKSGIEATNTLSH